MLKPIAAIAATFVGWSLATASAADAGHRHRHGSVSIYIGAPFFYGGYGFRGYTYDDGYHGYRPYRPYYRGYDYRPPAAVRYSPPCYRWGWKVNRYGEPRRRCVAW